MLDQQQHFLHNIHCAMGCFNEYFTLLTLVIEFVHIGPHIRDIVDLELTCPYTWKSFFYDPFYFVFLAMRNIEDHLSTLNLMTLEKVARMFLITAQSLFPREFGILYLLILAVEYRGLNE